MQGVEHSGERFLGGHQVAKIGPAVAATYHAAAVWVGRFLVFGKAPVSDVQAPSGGEQQSVPGGAGGQVLYGGGREMGQLAVSGGVQAISAAQAAMTTRPSRILPQ